MHYSSRRVSADVQPTALQRFASLADVGYAREAPQVEGEFLLGYAPIRAQPTPQERPDPFHGMHMDFTPAVAIVIQKTIEPLMQDTIMPGTLVAQCIAVCRRATMVAMGTRRPRRGARLCRRWALQ